MVSENEQKKFNLYNFEEINSLLPQGWLYIFSPDERGMPIILLGEVEVSVLANENLFIYILKEEKVTNVGLEKEVLVVGGDPRIIIARKKPAEFTLWTTIQGLRYGQFDNIPKIALSILAVESLLRMPKRK